MYRSDLYVHSLVKAGSNELLLLEGKLADEKSLNVFNLRKRIKNNF